jgi:NADH-quinone oxidoreductase subunit I
MSVGIETTSFISYFKNIYETMRTCLVGMSITFKYVWAHKAVTIEYPEVREVLPDRARMRLYNDATNCIACNMCMLTCPVDCIYISSANREKGADVPKTNTGHTQKQILTQFVIDTSLCCYCGLCTTVCPTECLTHSNDYEYSQFTVEEMKYDYLDPEVIAWRDRIVK